MTEGGGLSKTMMNDGCPSVWARSGQKMGRMVLTNEVSL